ncbi:hypothetical protein [Flavobacterium sp.]|uniref:hypothetical protein n=1 Tax=Flavobacterium sp. TaxID=239 RepID=UPI00286AA27C|nr:hypothetical protein [Flavobacterium sp.]
MKNSIIYLILIILFCVGCAKRQYHLKKNEIFLSNAISLDAYQSNFEKNNVKSVMNSNKFNKMNIILDGKVYESTLFKSIMDTIKGSYGFEIDNNKKILIINRIQKK